MLFYMDPYGGAEYDTLHTFKLELTEENEKDYQKSPKIRLIRDKFDNRLLLCSERYDCGHMDTSVIELTVSLAKQMFPHLADKL